MWSSVVIVSALLVTSYGQSVSHPDGSSNSFRQFADSGAFNFGYDVVRVDGSKDSRQESGDVEGNRVGSYSLTDHDGRVRVVDYTADKEGFRAVIILALMLASTTVLVLASITALILASTLGLILSSMLLLIPGLIIIIIAKRD